ncbi:hypothetical protein R6Q57_026251 [Mikania cordata]
MGFLDLLSAASMPVLKVLIVIALGSFLALDSVGILGQRTRKQVNDIVFFVFTPSLVGSNLSSSITLESIISMWFMPVNILLTFIVGSALGWVLLTITRPPQHLKGLVLGTCAAGNLGSLPFIIIPAICKEKGSPFGDPDVCNEFGMVYASLSMAVGAIFLWTYVYNLVRVFSVNSTNSSNNVVASVKVTGTMGNQLTECLLPSSSSTVNIKGKWKIVGFMIGTVTPMRRLLIGTTAPLRVIQDSATLLGEAAVPTMTLIVGGNLLKGLKGSGVSLSLVIGIVVERFIFMPLFGILIVKGAIYYSLVHEDPLYLFVLLLQFALPPAMNIGTITQLFGAGETECSEIMLWTYGLASISLTFWCMFFMWLMGFLDLFSAASMPVLKVLIVTALGSFLALDSINILGQSARKHVNELVFFVFNPALVGSNLANTITYESLISLWFMPVNILLTFIIGSVLGWVLILIAKPSQHLRGLVLGTCSAGNLGNMLLIIVPAVCKEKGTPFGDADVCSEYGMAYASLSMAIGAVFLWSYVYNLVRVFSEDSGNIQTETVQEDLTIPLLPSSESTPPIEGKMKVMLNGMKRHCGNFSKRVNLSAIFAPSTTGAIVGFVIGTIAPIRNLLIGTTAPLRVIQDSASLVGDAAVPVVSLVVGGNLVKGKFNQ